MPNPAILNALANPARIELADPMDQYGKMLQMQNYLEKSDEARREREDINFLSQAYNLYGNDPASRRNWLAQNRGALVPKYDKGEAEIDKIKADTKKVGIEGRKTKSEILDAFLKRSREFLAGVDADNPRIGVPQYINRLRDAYNQPDYLEYLAEIGKKPADAFEEDLSALNEAVGSGKYSDLIRKLQMGVEKATQQRAMMVSEEGKQTLVGVPEHGGAPRNLATYGPAPKAAGTSVTVINPGPKAANSFGDTYGQESAKQFVAVENANRSALNAYPRVDRALQILDDGVTAGALSSQITDARALAKQFGFSVDDKRLINTQELRQMLLGFVFDNVSQLKAAGVSLTPMTDHDIQMLKDSIAKGTDDVETIRRYLLKYRESLQNINQQYHEMAKQYGRSPVGPALRAVPADSPGSIPSRQPAGAGEAPDDLLRRMGVQ